MSEPRTITLTELDAVWFLQSFISDCSSCGGTHTDIGFERVEMYEAELPAIGRTAIVTHEGRCPVTGGVIYYGYLKD